MSVLKHPVSIDDQLYFRESAQGAAGSSNNTDVAFAGGVPDSGGIIVNITQVSSTATVTAQLYGSNDDSTYTEIYECVAFSAIGKYFLPIGPHTKAGTNYTYLRVKSTIANASATFSAYYWN